MAVNRMRRLAAPSSAVSSWPRLRHGYSSRPYSRWCMDAVAPPRCTRMGTHVLARENEIAEPHMKLFNSDGLEKSKVAVGFDPTSDRRPRQRTGIVILIVLGLLIVGGIGL